MRVCSVCMLVHRVPVALQDLGGLTVATPGGSTCHYQLLYLLNLLHLNDAVTVIEANPADMDELWSRGDISGAFVWEPHASKLRTKFAAHMIVSSGTISLFGAPVFGAYMTRRGALSFPETRNILRSCIGICTNMCIGMCSTDECEQYIAMCL